MRWPPPPDWPHADRSRQVHAPPHRWHLQEMGEGPVVLLLHGAGASTHSFRDLMPRLAEGHRAVALDLPGQGFTRAGSSGRFGLEAMTEDLLALIEAEGLQPAAILGHSAGGAVALAAAERLDPAPAVIGLNAALQRFEGMAGWLFPMIARGLSSLPFTADLFIATSTSEANVARLIRGTGSEIGPEGIALYRRLTRSRAHVAATLSMMAQWDVGPLHARLARHPSRALLIAGGRDGAVPARVSEEAAALMPRGAFAALPDLGHLAHEEAPDRVAALIEGFLA